MSKKPKFSPEFFEKVKGSMETAKPSGQFDDILKFPEGNTYTLKLLADLENPEKTFFHHKVHTFKSPKTGQFVSVLSLQTFGERDPIAEYRWKLYSKWKKANPNPPEDVKYKGPIDQKEQWLGKVYVADYPGNEELNGTVRKIRIGKQIKDIIDSATEGKRSEELGWEVFDLESGFDLKIDAVKQGEFTTFKDSFFTTRSKFKLSEEEIERIYDEASKIDLTQVYPVKTYDELKELLEEHFGDSEGGEVEEEERKPLAKIKDKKETKTSKSSKDVEVKVEEDPDDDIPMFHDGEDSPDINEELDALLEGLDNE